MKRYINTFIISVISISILTLIGCECHTEAWQKLDIAEGLMESRPDSSLVILNSITEENLGGKAESARYALLKSMALDKNYIDTTDFKVLQPAIDYYMKKGSPDERLKTYYYQGVIFLNKGNLHLALDSFVKGNHFANACRDSLTLARLLVAEGRLYNNYYDYDKYVSLYLQAADIYRHLSNSYMEFDCLINALNGSILLDNRSKCDTILKELDRFNSLDMPHKNRLARQKISYVLKFGSNEELKKLISSQELVINSHNDILSLALAYNKLGNNEIAHRLLNNLIRSNQPYDTLKYLAVSVDNLEKTGLYKEALDQYKRFSRKQDSIILLKNEQNLQTIAKNYQHELKAKEDSQQKTVIILGCLCGIILLILIIFILSLFLKKNHTKKEMQRQRAIVAELENEKLQSEKELSEQKAKAALLENENLAHRVEILKSESESLKSIIGSHAELPQEVQDTIKVRLEMLNSLLASHITSNTKHVKPYEMWLKEQTKDKETFMNSNRTSLQSSHPKFIQYFIDHGLTTEEINYICLYAIGLNGKEVGKYLNKPSHVNMSSAIRSKLGMNVHETNLAIYIRHLLKTY